MGNFLRSVTELTTQVFIKVSGQGVRRGPSTWVAHAESLRSLASEKSQRKGTTFHSDPSVCWQRKEPTPVSGRKRESRSETPGIYTSPYLPWLEVCGQKNNLFLRSQAQVLWVLLFSEVQKLHPRRQTLYTRLLNGNKRVIWQRW